MSGRPCCWRTTRLGYRRPQNSYNVSAQPPPDQREHHVQLMTALLPTRQKFAGLRAQTVPAWTTADLTAQPYGWRQLPLSSTPAHTLQL